MVVWWLHSFLALGSRSGIGLHGGEVQSGGQQFALKNAWLGWLHDDNSEVIFF